MRLKISVAQKIKILEIHYFRRPSEMVLVIRGLLLSKKVLQHLPKSGYVKMCNIPLTLVDYEGY